jgi:hypothetical protein
MQQLWRTWSRAGLEGRPGLTTYAVSPGLAAADGDLPGPLSDVLLFDLPPGITSATRPDDMPVSLTYLTPPEGRVLAQRAYVGLDGVGRPGNYFVHVLTDLPPEFRTIDAVRSWRSPFWRTSVGDKRPGVALPIVSARDVEPGSPDLFRWDATFRTSIRDLLAAYLSRREDQRVFVLGLPEFVGRLVAALVTSLPERMVADLSFSLFEADPVRSQARMVGACGAPLVGGKPRAGYRLPAECYRHTVIDGVSGLHSRADLTPQAQTYADFAAERLTDPSRRAELDDVVARTRGLGVLDAMGLVAALAPPRFTPVQPIVRTPESHGALPKESDEVGPPAAERGSELVVPPPRGGASRSDPAAQHAGSPETARASFSAQLASMPAGSTGSRERPDALGQLDALVASMPENGELDRRSLYCRLVLKWATGGEAAPSVVAPAVVFVIFGVPGTELRPLADRHDFNALCRLLSVAAQGATDLLGEVRRTRDVPRDPDGWELLWSLFRGHLERVNSVSASGTVGEVDLQMLRRVLQELLRNAPEGMQERWWKEANLPASVAPLVAALLFNGSVGLPELIAILSRPTDRLSDTLASLLIALRDRKSSDLAAGKVAQAAVDYLHRLTAEERRRLLPSDEQMRRKEYGHGPIFDILRLLPTDDDVVRAMGALGTGGEGRRYDELRLLARQARSGQYNVAGRA